MHLKIKTYELRILTLCLAKYRNKNAILQDTPFSTAEFDKIWKQLCAFEVLGRAWLPTPSALAMVWKSILSAASIRGVNLEKRFNLKSITEMVGNDGFPWALCMAVTNVSPDSPPALLYTSDTISEDVSLNRDKTVQWVGIICLQRAGESEQANTEGIPQSNFLAQWHDLLPEGWRKHASMELLKAKYFHSDPTKEATVFGEDIYDPTSLESLPSASTGGKANRKWHEKFKKGRK
ncbi:MAG: hypothetical protein Q9161_001511 [Pseudevernia consocians]